MTIFYAKQEKKAADASFEGISTTAAKALGLSGASAKTTGAIATKPSGENEYWLGLGDLDPSATSSKNVSACLLAGRKFAIALGSFSISSIKVDLCALKMQDEWIGAFARGMFLGGYRLGLWKQEQATEINSSLEVTLLGKAPVGKMKQVLAKAEATAKGQMAAMHLVDRPANAKKPQDVANYVLELAAEHGFTCEVLDEEALEIQGFGGILAVGRGSAYPPRLLKLHYNGGGKNILALVGKGITFDTGGISIKPSQNLGAMKSDLGGAAAVLGTFVSAAALNLNVELYGLIPVAENAINGDAYLPSDVIRNYSGKTIEITDTDAEGRLVLADALAYLPEWCTPDLTIDLATLTGSSVRTFGYACAALFVNDDNLVSEFSKAGNSVAERTWPLPLWETYEADLHSDVADVKHFHGKPIAGAINAAKFLEYFVADKQHWAHLDIAGVAFGHTEFSKDRSATGYGVALLTEFLINRTNEL